MSFIFAGDTNLAQNLFYESLIILYSRRWRVAQHTQNKLLLSNYNNSCRNAPQRYPVPTWPILLKSAFDAVTCVQHVWNVMAHPQKPDLVFQRNGRVHLNWEGSQFSRLLAVEECGTASRPWIDHARVVATLSNRLFPLHFSSHASPCAITFRTASTFTHKYRSNLGVNYSKNYYWKG